MRKEGKEFPSRKSVAISQLSELLAQYPHFYLVDVEGMNSEATSAMRRKCFQQNVKMVVVKNTMLQKAFDAAETDFNEFNNTLVGTTAVLFSETANVPARLIKDLTSKKQEKPALKAAYAEDMIYVGADKLATLCALKSKNELIADVIAALESPIMNILSGLENKDNSSETSAE